MRFRWSRLLLASLMTGLTCSAPLASAPQREQLGFVVDPAGTRLADVRVHTSLEEDFQTDATGSFRLKRPGELVRFSKPGFRPRTVTVAAASGQIVLVPAEQAPWTPPACSSTTAKRFGGIIQFTAPNGVRLRHVSDIDYRTTSLRHGRSWLQFGTGPHWIYGLPSAREFTAMTHVVERDVIIPRGIAGAEYRGTRPDGSRWRTIVFFLESIKYEAPASDAAFFDRILDSLCYSFQPQR